MHYFFLFFILAQLAALKVKLKASEEAVASSSNTGSIQHMRVERPKKLGNLQEAMLLVDRPLVYRSFCVSNFSFLLSVLKLNYYFTG